MMVKKTTASAAGREIVSVRQEFLPLAPAERTAWRRTLYDLLGEMLLDGWMAEAMEKGITRGRK